MILSHPRRLAVVAMRNVAESANVGAAVASRCQVVVEAESGIWDRRIEVLEGEFGQSDCCPDFVRGLVSGAP